MATTLTLLSDGKEDICLQLRFEKGRSAGRIAAGKTKSKIRLPPGCQSLTATSPAGVQSFSFDPPLAKGEERTLTLKLEGGRAAKGKDLYLRAKSKGEQEKLSSAVKQKSPATKKKKKKSTRGVVVAVNLTGLDLSLEYRFSPRGKASGSMSGHKRQQRMQLPPGCVSVKWHVTADKSIGGTITFPGPLAAGQEITVKMGTAAHRAHADRPPEPPTKVEGILLKDQTCDVYPFFTLLDSHDHPHLNRLVRSLTNAPEGQRKFVDPTFDLSKQNLLSPSAIEWLRPDELFTGKKTRLFEPKEDILAGGMGIKQGKIGNCWLIATMACLYNFNPDWMRDLIPLYRPDLGLVVCKFHKIGRWRYVLIDDRLPVSAGKLCYASNNDPGVLWASFLEKAYAKLMGGYKRIVGGQVSYAVTDLSGHLTHEMNLADLREEFDTDGDGTIDSAECCALMDNLKARFHVMERLGIECLCACFIKSAHGEHERKDGLVAGHAYTVLDDSPKDVQVDGRTQRLVHLRNPWGRFEWTGKWSDDDPIWQRPSIKKQLKNAVTDDGKFWMPCEDFVRIFDKISVIPHWDHSKADKTDDDEVDAVRTANVDIEFGEWPAGAGGSGNDPAKWAQNPQFWFKWTRADADLSNLDLMLYQSDHVFISSQHGSGNMSLFPAVALQFWKAPRGKKRLTKPLASAMVHCTKFQRRRQVSADMDHLPPGEYLIVPTTLEPAPKDLPSDLRVFVLSVCASEAVDLQPLQACAAEWDGADALREMMGDNVSDEEIGFGSVEKHNDNNNNSSDNNNNNSFSCAALPPSPPPRTSSLPPPPTRRSRARRFKVSSGKKVNRRKNKDTKSSKIGALDPGFVFTAAKVSGNRVQLRARDGGGWVSIISSKGKKLLCDVKE